MANTEKLHSLKAFKLWGFSVPLITILIDNNFLSECFIRIARIYNKNVLNLHK